MLLISVLTAAILTLQPPEAPPSEVCLTNACSTPLAKPDAMSEAITANDAYAIAELGGTPAQSVEANVQRYRASLSRAEPRRQEQITRELNNLLAFADTSDGSTFTFGTSIPNGVRIVERRGTDGSLGQLMLLPGGNSFLVPQRPQIP